MTMLDSPPAGGRAAAGLLASLLLGGCDPAVERTNTFDPANPEAACVGAPYRPALALPALPAPGLTAERTIAVAASHPDCGVRLVVHLDDRVVCPTGRANGDGGVGCDVHRGRDGWPDFTIELGEEERVYALTVYAVAGDGRRSAPAREVVLLDRTPPRGRLWVNGGAPTLRGRSDAVVEIVDADADARTFGARSVSGEPDGVCDAPCAAAPVECDTPVDRPRLLVVGEQPGRRCICGAICDAVGNTRALDPVAIELGPIAARPRPVLDRVDPQAILAVAAEPAERFVCLVGRHIAADTEARFDNQVLDCTAPPHGCAAPVGIDDAAVCAVALPDSIRFDTGRYEVGLVTPPPVDGDGTSVEDVQFDVFAPDLQLDRIAPLGVVARPRGADGAVTLTIEGRHLTDDATFAIAGRSGFRGPITRDPDGRFTVEVTFDLAGVAPDPELDAALRIDNGDGMGPSVPFGIAPIRRPCPPDGPCRVPVRRSQPLDPTHPGHVAVDLTPPESARRQAFEGRGGTAWTLAREGRTPSTTLSANGVAFMPLPGPQPGATVRVSARPHEGDVWITSAPSRRATLPTEPMLSACTHPLVDDVDATARADLDGDGQPQWLMVDDDFDRLAVQGVAEALPLQRCPRPGLLATGDLTGNGRPDVVVGSASPAGHALCPLYTSTNGRLTEQAPIALDGRPTAATIADVDGDGAPEIVAALSAPDGGSTIAAWPVFVDGRIGDRQVLWATDDVIEGLRAHDVDDDRVADLIVGGPAGVWVLHGGPALVADGATGDPLYLGGMAGAWFAVGDDGLGFDRLIVPFAAGPTTRLVAYRGRPGPAWIDDPVDLLGDAELSAAFAPLLVADLDNDGQPELLGAEPRAGGLELVELEVRGAAPPRRRAVDPFDAAPGAIVAAAIEAAVVEGALALSVVLDDGRICRIEQPGSQQEQPDVCGGGAAFPDLELPELVDGPVRWVWADVDADGLPESIAASDGRVHIHDHDTGVWRPAIDAGLAPGEPVSALRVLDDGRLAVAAGEEYALLSADGVVEPLRPVDGSIVALLPDGSGDVLAVTGRGAFGRDGPVDCADGRPARAWVIGEPPRLAVLEDQGGGVWRLPLPARGRCERITVAETGDVLDWVPADLDGDGTPERVEVTHALPHDAPAGAQAPVTVQVRRVVRGGDGPRFGEPDPGAIDLGRITASQRPERPMALAMRDVDVDGRDDLLLLTETAAADGVVTRAFVLFGSGDGGLRSPFDARPGDNGTTAWIRTPCPPEAVGRGLAIGAVDLDGGGRPEVVVGHGPRMNLTDVASAAPIGLWITAEPAPDGCAVSFALPGGVFGALVVALDLERPSPVSEATLTTPDGEQWTLLDRPDPVGFHWWVLDEDDGPLARPGPRPGGAWRFEASTGDGGCSPAAVLVWADLEWDPGRPPAGD